LSWIHTQLFIHWSRRAISWKDLIRNELWQKWTETATENLQNKDRKKWGIFLNRRGKKVNEKERFLFEMIQN
jgi:hypothetical protein